MIDAFPLFLLEIQAERGVFCMYMKDAIAEYGFDCRIRKLSPKTIDCYINTKGKILIGFGVVPTFPLK